MPTTYPGAKHDLLNPSPETPTISPTIPHAELHTDINDLIEAIQAKLGLGVNNQAALVNTVLRGLAAGETDFGKLFNAHIDSAAAIAYTKLALANSIMNADINANAAIAYTKLALANSIKNADVAANAAIAYAKLNLAGSIVDSDIAPGATIPWSKTRGTGYPNTILATGDGTNCYAQYADVMLRDRMVPGTKLAVGTVGATEIADGSVSWPELGPNAITTRYTSAGGGSNPSIGPSPSPVLLADPVLTVGLNAPGQIYGWVCAEFSANDPGAVGAIVGLYVHLSGATGWVQVAEASPAVQGGRYALGGPFSAYVGAAGAWNMYMGVTANGSGSLTYFAAGRVMAAMGVWR